MEDAITDNVTQSYRDQERVNSRETMMEEPNLQAQATLGQNETILILQEKVDNLDALLLTSTKKVDDLLLDLQKYVKVNETYRKLDANDGLSTPLSKRKRKALMYKFTRTGIKVYKPIEFSRKLDKLSHEIKLMEQRSKRMRENKNKLIQEIHQIEEEIIDKVTYSKKSKEGNDNSSNKNGSIEDDKKCVKFKEEKKVVIVGGDQCRDLASNLIASRLSTRYVKYNVEAWLKPGASSNILLNICKHLKLNKEDKLFLCIGEDETDPIRLSFEMYSVLKSLESTSVFLLSIIKNKARNEATINALLRNVAKYTEQCFFIDIDKNAEDVMKDMCKKINYHIDTTDYNNKFLPQYVTNIHTLFEK